jgi:hypothetical protein
MHGTKGVLYPLPRGSVLLDENFLMQFLFLHPRNTTNNHTNFFLIQEFVFHNMMGKRMEGFYSGGVFVFLKACLVIFVHRAGRNVCLRYTSVQFSETDSNLLQK